MICDFDFICHDLLLSCQSVLSVSSSRFNLCMLSVLSFPCIIGLRQDTIISQTIAHHQVEVGKLQGKLWVSGDFIITLGYYTSLSGQSTFQRMLSSNV